MADAPEKGFEDILKDLTRIVEKLEKGNLPLEKSITLYTRGVELLKSAQGVLDKAQVRLEVLMSSDGEEEPQSREVDPSEFLDDE